MSSSRRPLSQTGVGVARYFKVGGAGRVFKESHWKDCIWHFLKGVLGEDTKFMLRPMVNFCDVTLMLNVEKREYYAFGVSARSDSPEFKVQETLTASCQRSEVEYALARFVENRSKKLLVIRFQTGGEMRLWKMDRHPYIGIAAQNVPKTFVEAVQPQPEQ